MGFLMQLAIVGAFLYWYGGFSFGMRFFINLTPFFAIGLAAVATRIRPVVARGARAGVGALDFVLVFSVTHTIKRGGPPRELRPGPIPRPPPVPPGNPDPGLVRGRIWHPR